jgi:low affinity Fe/Cu permease
MHAFFDRFTTGCARFAGQPAMLMLCLLISVTGIAAFLSKDEFFISGANLTISIVTLLILPILQATQNRDGAALQAKIDELIKATADARDDLIGLEERGETEIKEIRRNAAPRGKTARGRAALRPVE